MKFFFSILLVLICLFGSASAENEQEILFLNIPWLSSDTDAVRILFEEGYVKFKMDGHIFLQEDNLFLAIDEKDNIIPLCDNNWENFYYSLSLNDNVKGKIAGYPIKSIHLSFAYDGEYKLILASAELLNVEYLELKGKIEKVYGQGLENTTVEGYTNTVWKGKNESCILLYTEDDGLSFNLYYGRLDAVKILSDALNIDHEDISGL